MTAGDPPTLQDVFRARQRIAGVARRTPLVPSSALSARSGRDVRLKLETLQDTGAFKMRGAANAVLGLDAPARARGVVAYSTGNHGRAVAAVAARLGIPATICVSTRTAPAKIAALRGAGCALRVEGASQDEAAAVARRLVERDGLSIVDPIADPAVIAGHGTVGLELLEDWPDLDTVIVPVSGGALIAGIALAVRAACPRCRIVGVSMAEGAAMHASLRAGRPVAVAEAPSLADSLQGGILLDNRHTFRMVRDLVDDLMLVDETAIADTMVHAFAVEGLVIEGAAATPIAALLDPRAALGRRVALVLTGNAVDRRLLARMALDRMPVDDRERAA